MDSENTQNRAYLFLVLIITVYKNMCFSCIIERSLSIVSFTCQKHMFDRNGNLSSNAFEGLYIFMVTSK